VNGNRNRSILRKSMLRSAWLYLFLAVALFLPLASRAQDTGYISGTVSDKSGSVVAGAEVMLKNVAGSLTRSTTTNADGAYVIPGLPGDTYILSVTAKGFEKFQATGVKLDVGQKSRVDIQLTVGAVTQTIEVTGESVAQVATQSSEIGNTITGRQVNQLELNGRNFTQLVILTPGVVDQTGSDEGKVGVYGNVSYSINGGRNEYNNWELDGGDNMDNGSNATLNVYPNLEAISEFKVLTSNYGAQYGRNGSGTIEVETKSGTTSFHGSAFYYGRNEDFNANDFFDNAAGNPRALYRKHDYGYTFGGPFYIPNHYNSNKKKTFFFWSEEWRRENNVSLGVPGSNGSSIADVPSAAERGGNFSDLCPAAGAGQVVNFTRAAFPDCPASSAGAGNSFNTFPGNTFTPTTVGTALLASIPASNITDPATGNPAFEHTVSTPTHWREELVRVDHNFTDKYRATFRYIHDSWNTVVPGALWGNNANGNLPSFQNVTTGFLGPGTSFVARLNANITPTLLNEFVASYTADHIFLTAGGTVSPAPTGMGSIFPQSTPFGGLIPAITLTSNAAYGGGFWTDTGYFPWNNANPTYTLRDNVTKIVGTHTFQFGAYVVFAQKNEMNSPELQGILTFDSTNSAVSTGNAFADLLLGNIASYKQYSAKRKYYNRYKIVEPYFQDDWRVTRRLTLNLGLRVSLFGTYRERYRQAFNFDPTQFNPANAPSVDVSGILSQNAANTANPLNGVVQCGGKGGTFNLIPGSAFQQVTIGSNSNAGCLSGHLFNPAPRIGFAFDPKGDGKTAIRGGYGIFFEHTNGNEGNTESLEGSAPLVLTATQHAIAVGQPGCAANAQGGYGCIGLPGPGGIPIPALSPFSIPNKALWPYMQQWNLGIQRELPSHVVMSVAYVGSKGTHLTLLNNLNQLHPVAPGQNPYSPGEPISNADCNSITTDANGFPTGATLGNGKVLTSNSPGLANLFVACTGSPDGLPNGRPFFGFDSINELRDIADSHYHALQVTATRTVGDLTLSVAYNYSHSTDDSSDRSDNAFVNGYNIASNKANSNFDMRHSASFSYVYNLPFFRRSELHNILGGWQISGITIAQTGLPFSVVNNTFGDSAGVANGTGTGSRPDLVSGQDPHNTSGFTNRLQFYNPNAYTTPTGLTFGNVGRNTLNLPGRLNFNFGMFKRFSIKERAGFEFRAESFNVFNHTQFNSINNSFSVGSTSFLQLNGTHDPRRLQLGLRFYF